LKGGLEALADSLEYDASLARHTLRGQPVVVRVPNKSATSCSRSTAREVKFGVDGSSIEFPSNPGGVDTRDVPCVGDLRR
jgi:hypothetical protein